MATSSTLRTRVMWTWKCNADPYDKNQKAEWKRYSDLQIHRIEETYQNKEECVELGEYIIDFKTMVQYRKDDEYRRRSVKREMVDANLYLREDRFGIAEKPKEISKSFGEPGAFFESSKLIEEWKKKYKNLCNSKDYSKVLEQAADGIVYEAQLSNQESEGQLIADQLLKVKHAKLKQVHDCCIRIYSMQTFLYGLVNKSLREEDDSKLDTLGAYCYLLLLNLYDAEKEHAKLFRGCPLNDELIEYYKKSTGKQIIWYAFTSLSRSREEAEKFGNTLFTVELTGNEYCSKDIAALSKYSYEQEVLLRPAHPLWVVKVEEDKKNKKYFVYLNDDPDYRPKQSDRPLP